MSEIQGRTQLLFFLYKGGQPWQNWEKMRKMMLETIRKFMAKEVAPYSREMDDTETYRKEIKVKCGELGFYAAVIPEEFGGMGLNLTSFCRMIEEMSKVDASVGVTIQDNGTGLRPLMLCNNQELKKEIFSKIVNEGASIGFAITESHAGSDAASIKTRAVRNGDVYVLNGSKTFITSGGMSDFYLVFAVTDPKGRHRGISGFVVDAKAPGLSIGKKESKLGLRASPTTDLILEDVAVPAKSMVGEENSAFFLLMRTLDASRPTIGGPRTGDSRRGAGICLQLHERARAVRAAHLRIPGSPMDPVRHGDQGGSGQGASLSGDQALRRRIP